MGEDLEESFSEREDALIISDFILGLCVLCFVIQVVFDENNFTFYPLDIGCCHNRRAHNAGYDG